MIDRLMEELDRLCEQYADAPEALAALEVVRFWAIEESVEDAEAKPDDMPFLCV